MTVQFPDLAPATTRITVMQGQARVSAGPKVEFSTVLGSCVCTCLFDPVAEVGGMNHFLLAEPPKGASYNVDEHYGVYLMELLINEMLNHGAVKSRLRAHLYGGANLNPRLPQIGARNAEFAHAFLSREAINVAREDLGGSQARRVDFRPARGQVRCRAVENTLAPQADTMPRLPQHSGDVDLF